MPIPKIVQDASAAYNKILPELEKSNWGMVVAMFDCEVVGIFNTHDEARSYLDSNFGEKAPGALVGAIGPHFMKGDGRDALELIEKCRILPKHGV